VAGLAAGVDLGGTKIQAAVVRNRSVVGQARVPTPQSGAAAVIRAIAATVRSALAEASASLDELAAVGIGTPGEVDKEAGAVSLSPNVPGFLRRVELGSRVSALLRGTAVVVDNDVRAAVLGEFKRGAGRPYRNLLGVFVGTGVGGGLVLEGRLRDGRGAAGEIGHTVVKDGGRLCGCGRRGCLEAYAGRSRMEARARKLAQDGKKTILFDIMKKRGRDRLTSGVIARALDRKDPVTVKLIDGAVWALGIALASAQNVLDLEAIIVGGGLGDRLGQPFVDRVAESMRPHVFADDHPPQILCTELKDLSGAVGAALMAETGTKR
jgi:glucokinase